MSQVTPLEVVLMSHGFGPDDAASIVKSVTEANRVVNLLINGGYHPLVADETLTNDRLRMLIALCMNLDPNSRADDAAITMILGGRRGIDDEVVAHLETYDSSSRTVLMRILDERDPMHVTDRFAKKLGLTRPQIVDMRDRYLDAVKRHLLDTHWIVLAEIRH